jgi:hypothetical protein
VEEEEGSGRRGEARSKVDTALCHMLRSALGVVLDVQGGGRGFSIHVSTRAQTSHAVAQTSRVAPYLPSMILNWLHTLSLDKA